MSTKSNNVASHIQKNFRDLEIEEYILAFLIRKMPSMSSTIKVNWFSSASYRSLFRIVQHDQSTFTGASLKRAVLDRKGNKLLLSRAKRIMQTDLSSATMRNVRLQIRQLYTLYVERTLLESSFSMLTKSLKKDSSYSLDQMKSDLSRAHQIATTSLDDDSRSGEFLEDYVKRYTSILFDQENISAGSMNYIPTGLHRFDSLIGGVLPGEFGVIIGRPGVGKTAALVSFSVNAWRKGYSILFISGEMQTRDVMHRIDSNVSGVPSKLFRLRSLKAKHLQQWDRRIHREGVRQRKKKQDVFFEVVGFDRNFTASAIADEIDRVEEKWDQKVDLLCIDYLNIMQSGSYGSGKDWKEQADVVWDVKSLCSERLLACWTASQVTDEGISAKEYTLAHVKYSRGIAETAPIVVGLLMSKDDELEGKMRLQVIKLRNAPSMNDFIILNPNFELMRLHEEKLPTGDENYLDTV